MADVGAHLAHDERILKILPEVLGNVAAKIENLVKRLATALKSTRKRIKETHLRVHNLSGLSVEPLANHVAHAVGLHRHTIQDISIFHRTTADER